MIRKNVLGSFSFDVAERILGVLSEYGQSIKKTNLADKAGLNYNVCLRYIHMLKILGWIDANPEVCITEEGKDVLAKLLQVSRTRTGNLCKHNVIGPNNSLEKSLIQSSHSDVSSTMYAKPLSLVIPERQLFSTSIQKSVNSKKKTIMIVDDDKDIAQIYESFLSSAGYRVCKFIDSRSALCQYLTDPFLYDLLILDIRMKDINGLQLYQSIKAINPECKAIFVSCLDCAGEVVRILPGIGTQHVMRKPVSKEQFVYAVRKALVE